MEQADINDVNPGIHPPEGNVAPESQREDPAALLPGTDTGSELTCTGCRGCGHLGSCAPGCCHSTPRNNLSSTNWLHDIPTKITDTDLVEVSFKNTRKGYYRNVAAIPLEIGDFVAVEGNPGHDIGKVTMVGPLVAKQIKKSGIKDTTPENQRRIFRKVRQADMEKYEEVRVLEHDTMIKARKIAEDLGLNMKIGDVEYQGDGNKAIFYYIADERVDFRQLIRVLADKFKIRVEMRQIGARQEAGRIGGIGPCGRPLCCATWMTNFVSVTTAAARFQDLSINLQKLAGQCGKLKCCLNFEVDAYLESLKNLPDKNVRLETEDGTWYTFKVDVFKREFTFSSDKQIAANLITIDAERVKEILEMNNNGEKPRSLMRDKEAEEVKKKTYNDILEEGNLNRFDSKKKKKKKKSKQAQPQQAFKSKGQGNQTKQNNPTDKHEDQK